VRVCEQVTETRAPKGRWSFLQKPDRSIKPSIGEGFSLIEEKSSPPSDLPAPRGKVMVCEQFSRPLASYGETLW